MGLRFCPLCGKRPIKHVVIVDGNCLSERHEKHVCQKCRWDRCLEIGMDARLIMSEEEKRQRFKHFFEKKDCQESIL
jgi:hypothetical protein